MYVHLANVFFLRISMKISCVKILIDTYNHIYNTCKYLINNL